MGVFLLWLLLMLLLSAVVISAQSAPVLMYSAAADRSNPVPLHGAVFAAPYPLAIFVPTQTGLTKVVFTIDGCCAVTEAQAPFDFRGTASGGAAVLWHAELEPQGLHTISADVTINAVVSTITATFRVGPEPPITASVINPTAVEFMQSADQTVMVCPPGGTDPTGNCTLPLVPMLTRYDLRFYLQGATDPMQTQDLGKPTPDATGLIVVDRADLFIGVPTTGIYQGRIIAVGPYGEGASPLSNTFAREPPALRPAAPQSPEVH